MKQLQMINALSRYTLTDAENPWSYMQWCDWCFWWRAWALGCSIIAPKHRHPQLKGRSISWLLKGWAPTPLFHTFLVWEVNHHELLVRCDVSDSTRAKAIPVLHRVARFPYPLPGASIFAPGHLEQKSERNSSTCSDQKNHSSSCSTIITSNCRCTDCHIKTWTAFEHIFLWRP